MNHKHKVFFLGASILAIVAFIGVLINIDGSVTSSVVVDQVSCFDNLDCNDRIEATEDICRSPGTPNSICINRPIK